ncbi:polysaccharide deacetylase family protein [Kitasatospora sp. NBC_00315]|uniref:polysaccharide deacetylase family protein n=1 Tax=Kitasatospora sp. NBC_00315 TaxID=2975963 RepID=UPI003250F0CB
MPELPTARTPVHLTRRRSDLVPEHLPEPGRRPARTNRALRRGLAAACAALVGSAVLAGCGGTAQGALRPPTATAPAAPSSSSSDPSVSSGRSGPGTSPGTSPTPSAPASASATRSPVAASSTPAPAAAAPLAATTPAPPPTGGVSPAVVTATASGGRSVALTFDDGPGPATGQILDLLARYGAKATFCQIGPQAAADPATVRRILAAGHRLCDHSVHHPQPFAALPPDRQVYEISAAREMIVRAGGPGTPVAWFRAPGGGFTAANQQVAASYGMRPLGWTVDTRDWAKPGVPAILAAVRRELRPGGVILMHDGGGDRSQTVAALRQLLPQLAAQGYTFDFPAT